MWHSEYRFPRPLPIGLAVLVALACAGDARAEAGKKSRNVLEELGCVSCHRIDAPPPEARTLASYAERKAPDLFYAGSKYRSEWLRSWLAHPTPIRPAGLHPAEHAKPGERNDVVATKPEPHPAVPAAKIDAVVAALEKLDWGKEHLPKTPPPSVKVPKALAELNFVKFKGCGSCHRTSKDVVPLSGPDLDDAYARLRPEFLTSFIANPQAWDPVAPMPNYGLPPNEVGKLVAYLQLLSEDDHVATAR